MATITGHPTSYDSGYSAYSVSGLEQGETDSSSTNYATINLTRNSGAETSIYYNFNLDIPETASITSVTCTAKCYISTTNSNRITTRTIQLYSGTTAKGSAYTVSNSTSEFSVTAGTWTASELKNAKIRIRAVRGTSNTNTNYYFRFYGATITVEYRLSARTITSTVTGNGTISPSGANTYYDDDEYEITITPTIKTDTVTATQDGVDITSQLVAHGSGGEQTASAVLGTYSLISGGFNGSGASYFQGLVGKGHTASQTTSNYYSSSSSTHAVFQYEISFSNIPSNAIITNLYMIANGHAESTSQSSEYMCVQLKSGNTELSEQYNFKSHGTSNGNVTVEATTLPTVSQLSSLVVEMTLGYYGGAVNGVTVYLEYEVPSGEVDHYTYTYIVSGDSSIEITIGSAENKIYVKVNGAWKEASNIYVKINGTWKEVLSAYKKENGAWVEQDDKSAMFDNDSVMIKG